jgi:lipoprotein-releasing system ATP-binding protein
MNDPAQPAPGGEVLLVARNLHKTYQMGPRKLEVLRGVSLSLNRGGFLAVQGASGAGKSTLLHLLGGLDGADAGDIWFAGERVNDMSSGGVARLRNTKIGFVFQAYHLLPELTALENVCLPARLARVDTGVAEKRGRELLARVGLAERLTHRPRELSGGEQQRVAIARSLINEPALILADEPTGNLDSHTGEEIIELLCALRVQRVAALIIATHDARIAGRAPEIMEMADGQMLRVKASGQG